MNRPLLTPEQQAQLTAWASQNPGFGAPQEPGDGAFGSLCSVDRVMLAGGQLTSYMTPRSIVPLEYVFRRLPIDGIFDATPSRPCQFQMGNLSVPVGMGFVLLDYNFAIYRPSGSAADDFVPLEENRLSTQVGWDIQVDGTRQGNYRYELNPIPPENNNPSFQSGPNPGFIPAGNGLPTPASDDEFTAARYTQAAAATGSALSLMPQRHHRQGLLHVPAPWIIHSNQSLTMQCSVFRAVQIPLAFFEASMFGFLMQDMQLREMEKAIAPCLSKSGGV